MNAGYIEELLLFNSPDKAAHSDTTRIRPERLMELFAELTIDLHNIDTHFNEECIILYDKYVDYPEEVTNRWSSLSYYA